MTVFAAVGSRMSEDRNILDSAPDVCFKIDVILLSFAYNPTAGLLLSVTDAFEIPHLIKSGSCKSQNAKSVHQSPLVICC